MRHSGANSGGERRRVARLAGVAALGLLFAACADTSIHPVEAYVFYDENGDLALDASELARVPGVDVTLGGRTGRSELQTGHVRIENVPEGQYTAEASHLPPYYVQKVPPTVTVPAAEPVLIAIQLDIGSNRPNVYMAFGDSITDGDGSSDGFGYRQKLQGGLVAHFGVGSVENEGVPGTRTAKGLARIDNALAAHRPAYSLILYGTNDWNDATCKWGNENCQTVEHLRDIVRAVRAVGSLPALATIIPCNPAYAADYCPPERNVWVDQTNKSLRTMAQSEGVVVADLYAAFMAQPDLVALFLDHVHPNDTGYKLIADGFLRAVTGDVTATTPSTPTVPAAIPAPALDPAAPSEPLRLLPLAPAPPDDVRDNTW